LCVDLIRLLPLSLGKVGRFFWRVLDLEDLNLLRDKCLFAISLSEVEGSIVDGPPLDLSALHFRQWHGAGKGHFLNGNVLIVNWVQGICLLPNSVCNCSDIHLNLFSEDTVQVLNSYEQLVLLKREGRHLDRVLDTGILECTTVVELGDLLLGLLKAKSKEHLHRVVDLLLDDSLK